MNIVKQRVGVYNGDTHRAKPFLRRYCASASLKFHASGRVGWVESLGESHQPLDSLHRGEQAHQFRAGQPFTNVVCCVYCVYCMYCVYYVYCVYCRYNVY
jgi:hypothetical protein